MSGRLKSGRFKISAYSSAGPGAEDPQWWRVLRSERRGPGGKLPATATTSMTGPSPLSATRPELPRTADRPPP
jgi:hypothetical protein